VKGVSPTHTGFTPRRTEIIGSAGTLVQTEKEELRQSSCVTPRRAESIAYRAMPRATPTASHTRPQDRAKPTMTKILRIRLPGRTLSRDTQPLPCCDCDELKERPDAEYGHHDSKNLPQRLVACFGEPL